MSQTLMMAIRLAGLLKEERSLLLHCFAGMGRSVLLAACVMVLKGTHPEDACVRISDARGISGLPETEEQRDWIFDFAEMLKQKRVTGF